MRVSFGRRQFLAGSSAALIAPDELGRLLGTNLPPQLTALLPREVFDGAALLRSLIALEQEAKLLRLPPSRLHFGDGGIPLDPDRLYELVLPRLVALVDRSELRNLGFADKAGELLFKLHGTQHVVPEGLMAVAPAPVPLGFSGDQQQAEPITLPPASVSVPDVQVDIGLPRPAPASPETALPPPADSEVAEMPDHISRVLRFDAIADEYAAMFKAAAFRPEHRESADWHLTMMRGSRSRYEAAGRRTGVPWYFIAAIHGLEASFNFRAHFHNGDFPLSRRTRQVPVGRPLVWLPPSDWESSTTDALRLMGFAGASDWSLPRTLYRLEAYNGFGYRRIGRASPYLWSFSTAYDRGKFVADGHYEPRARSQQCGAAVMLKLLADAGEIAFPA